MKLVPSSATKLYGYALQQRIRYTGDGSSVAKGAYGCIKQFYESGKVECLFDDGTLLILEHTAIESAGQFTKDGWYSLYIGKSVVLTLPPADVPPGTTVRIVPARRLAEYPFTVVWKRTKDGWELHKAGQKAFPCPGSAGEPAQDLWA